MRAHDLMNLILHRHTLESESDVEDFSDSEIDVGASLSLTEIDVGARSSIELMSAKVMSALGEIDVGYEECRHQLELRAPRSELRLMLAFSVTVSEEPDLCAPRPRSWRRGGPCKRFGGLGTDLLADCRQQVENGGFLRC